MATYTTRTTVLLVLLSWAILTPSLQNAAATEIAPPLFSGEADQASYDWASNLFADGGFELPTVEIEFHRSDEACGGMRGRTHLTTDDAVAVIHVCAVHDRPTVEDAWRRRTLLHELAHAWIDQNVSDADTAALMELRKVDTWLSRDVLWQDRGAEHAAEIFMWGIQARDYRLDFRLDDGECGNLAAAYEILTGNVVACASE